jgi:microcystin-dependent protein
MANTVPIGGVVLWPSVASVPTGYLTCDGSAVSRATYAALFAAIGVTNGAGDGSTTFNLPNMTGNFLMGAGTTAPGTVGGSATWQPSTHSHAPLDSNSDASGFHLHNAPTGETSDGVWDEDTNDALSSTIVVTTNAAFQNIPQPVNHHHTLTSNRWNFGSHGHPLSGSYGNNAGSGGDQEPLWVSTYFIVRYS